MGQNEYLRWLSSETPSIYWHDSANLTAIEEAIRNGATGVTTNPFLVQDTLAGSPDVWEEDMAAAKTLPPGPEKAEAKIAAVAGRIAKRMEREHRGFGTGYCCAQTDPTRPGDAIRMIEQAKRYVAAAPNLVIKLPSTKAGLLAYEECAALGMNVCATVSFTVAQTLAAAEAYERGAARARQNGITPSLGIAVLMVGRLDDYLRDAAADYGLDLSEAEITKAGLAAIKRAYKIFCEREYSCILMPAGCRCAEHITELAGARMIFSIAPKIERMLMECKPPFQEVIREPVDEKIISRLSKLPEFCKAYEPDGLAVSEFIGYGAANRTINQFSECGWNLLAR